MEMASPGSEEQKLARLEEGLWVTQAQGGDVDAFARLLNRYEKPLLYYLRRLVPESDAALDLHQEVWIDAFRGLRSLQVPEAFRVWIYRIAHHKAARFIRNKVREEDLAESLSDLAPQSAPLQCEETFNAEALHKALEKLPTPQRELLTLHYLRELSTEEIGLVLDCPPGTIKSRLYHARLALRRLIEKQKL